MLFVTCSFHIDSGSKHPTLKYIWETRNAERWQRLANIKMSMERNQVLMLWPGHAVLIKQTNKSAFSWMHLEFPTGTLSNSLKSFFSFYLLIYCEEEVGKSMIPSGFP